MRYTLPLAATGPQPFDRRFQDVHPLIPRAQLPETINLGEWLGPMYNQNPAGLGECSGESGAGAMDWLCRRYRAEAFVGSGTGLYEVERQLIGQLGQDTGARLRQTQIAMQTVGVWDLILDPDTRADFETAITPAMIASAAKHRIRDGLWCPTLDEILNALAHPTTPVVVQVGIVVYPSFEAQATMASGIVPMPGSGENPLGGHAVLAFGADFKRGLVFLRNSWGPCYGAEIGGPGYGNFALPFAYFAGPRTFLSARAYSL